MAVRTYGPDTDFGYVCTMALTMEIRPLVKDITHPWVMDNNSRSEPYRVLSQFLSTLRYTYRRNCKNTFYLLVYFKIESEIAVKSYKQYLFVLYPKIHILLVLQCSKSIIFQSKWCTCQ